MNREVHVRFCEGVGVKFPRATRPLIHTSPPKNLAQDIESINKRSRSSALFLKECIAPCLMFLGQLAFHKKPEESSKVADIQSQN